MARYDKQKCKAVDNKIWGEMQSSEGRFLSLRYISSFLIKENCSLFHSVKSFRELSPKQRTQLSIPASPICTWPKFRRERKISRHCRCQNKPINIIRSLFALVTTVLQSWISSLMESDRVCCPSFHIPRQLFALRFFLTHL